MLWEQLLTKAGFCNFTIGNNSELTIDKIRHKNIDKQTYVWYNMVRNHKKEEVDSHPSERSSLPLPIRH